MITEGELNELKNITPNKDKGSINKMIDIYNKYNTPKLDGCTCSSHFRVTARKTVLDWYNSIINESI